MTSPAGGNPTCPPGFAARSSICFLALSALLSAFLASCSPLSQRVQGLPSGLPPFQLTASESVGQTFVAWDDGLSGIEIYLLPGEASAGQLVLHLRESSQSQADLASGSLSTADVRAPGFYHFGFSPLPSSRGRYYYALVEMQGTGRVGVGAAAGNSYLDGALYVNGSPVDAQAAFGLDYSLPSYLLGLAQEAARWLAALALGIFLFLLPGWALLTFLWAGFAEFPWLGKAGIAAGLSLALYPLLLLWTHLLGIQIGALVAWVPGLLACATLLWHSRGQHLRDFRARLSAWRSSGNFAPDLVGVLLLGLVFGARFWVVRGLDLPLWGDSYQHTVITQLLIDHGGLFDSWKPYADLTSFDYHFGFHSAAAAFHWLSGASAARSVLWAGQILNGLAALCLYPLAYRLTRNRWAGVVALLLGGLLSPMPMFYTNWGRYTQLGGQVILSAAVLLAWFALEQDRRSPASFLLASIAWAGLALTHYRVIVFAIAFLPAALALQILSRRGRKAMVSLLLLAGGSFLLFLPWFVHLYGGKLFLYLSRMLGTLPAQVSPAIQQSNQIGDLSYFLPWEMWLVLALAAVWALIRRERNMLLVIVWWLVVLLSANPQWLGLPGLGLITNFAVLIALYIPVSVLGGTVIGHLAAARPRWAWLVFAGVLGLGLWGTWLRAGDIDKSEYSLATRPDLRAAAWIAAHTAADARFLVNSFSAYGNTVVVGSDGGWWLPLISGRGTTLPPINYASEQGTRPDYVQWVNALTRTVADEGVASEKTLAALAERGVGYVYIGQREGRVNYGGPDVLSPSSLLSSPHYRPVYHEDQVWIFAVVP